MQEIAHVPQSNVLQSFALDKHACTRNGLHGGVGASGKGSMWSKKSENREGNHLPRCDKPKVRMNARLGVGKTLRPPGCSEPSGLQSSPPTIPIEGLLSSTSIMRRKAPGASTLSGLRNNRVSAAEAQAPRLHAAAKPRLLPFLMIRTRSSEMEVSK
jgi:hypothetical protein